MATYNIKRNEEECEAEEPEVECEAEEPEDSPTDLAVVKPAARSVTSASGTMILSGHDQQLREAGSRVAHDLGQIELSSTLQKADAMFQTIMDPNNEDTKKLVSDLFYTPMKEITDKALAAVTAIDVQDPTKARDTIQLAREIMELSKDVRETALDHVYDNMARQVDHFSTSVDVYNSKMKETVLQALELYKDRIDAEIEVRSKVLQQKKEEHSFMLKAASEESKARVECALRESQAETEIAGRRLEQQKKRDQREHEKELKALEREDKKAEAELERQRKKNEIEHKKMEQQLDRQYKDAQRQHEKMMKDLEAQAKKGKIEGDIRDSINNELKIEMSRYQKEFDLAQEAMRGAIARGGSCQIKHSAPKIDWGPPPRVIPGSVSWEMQR